MIYILYICVKLNVTSEREHFCAKNQDRNQAFPTHAYICISTYDNYNL